MRSWLALSCVCFMMLVGCSYRVTMMTEPVPVTGKFFADNRPIVDATLMLQPMDDYGHPTSLSIDKNGNFKGKVTSGKYFFYLLLPANQYHQLRYLPDGILSPTKDRTLAVPENGGEIIVNVKKE